MGNIGRDLPHARHQRFDAIEHAVQVGRQAVELFIHADHRHALVELSGHDDVDRLVQPFKPLGKDGRDHVACDEREDGNADPAAQRHRIEPFAQFLHVMDVRPDDQSRAARQRRSISLDRTRSIRNFPGRSFPGDRLLGNDRARPALRACRFWQIAREPLAGRILKEITKRALPRPGQIPNGADDARHAGSAVDRCQTCRFVRQRVGRDLLGISRHRCFDRDHQHDRTDRKDRGEQQRKPERSAADGPIQQHRADIPILESYGSAPPRIRDRSWRAGGSCGFRSRWFAGRSGTTRHFQAASCA